MDEDTIDQRISSLKIDLDDLGAKIVKHIEAVHSSSLPSFNVDLKDDPTNCIKSLRYDIDDILKIATDRSDQLEEFAGDLQQCQGLVQILETVNGTADLLCRLDDAISDTDLKLTCTLLNEVTESVNRLPGSSTEYGVGNCVIALRREAAILKSRFISKLKRLLDCHLQIDVGSIQLIPQLLSHCYIIPGEIENLLAVDDSLSESDVGSTLVECWDALVYLNVADDSVSVICRQLWDCVVKPLWSEQSSTNGTGGKMAPTVTRELDSKRQETVALTLPWMLNGSNAPVGMRSVERTASAGMGAVSMELGVCKIPFPVLLENLSGILCFLASEVLCNNSELIVMAHRCMFQLKPIALGNCLCSTLTALIPESERLLDGFRAAMEKPCRDFEEKCAAAQLPCINVNTSKLTVPSSGGSGGNPLVNPLSTIISELNGKYCDSRRRQLLSRARDTLLSDYHNTMFGTGDALEDDVASAGNVGDAKAMIEQSGASAMQALSFDCCQISLAAWRILRLCNEVMKEACLPSSSEHNSHVLYQSARDCLDLFIAIIPVKFGEVIDTVPRMGAVFYNDCSYIAHNCTLITFRYRRDMAGSAILKENIGFVDFIPRLRSLGQKCLAKHTELQKSTLLSCLDSIRLSPLGDSGDAGNNDEGAVRTMNHLEQLRSQWQNVLPDNVYERIMGYLVECIIRSAVAPVQAADVIAATAATDIGRIFRSLSKCKNVLLDTQEENVLRMVPSYNKFCVLTELLDYSISEVMEWLPRKKFSSFTSAELSALIKALFDHSERRQNILNLILDMSK